MLFLINMDCNRNCSYCFEGDMRRKEFRRMTVEDIHRIAKWAGPAALRICNVLGGEPTLHPQVVPIMKAIIGYSSYRPPLLLTNGLGDPEVMRALAKDSIRFVVNINHLDAYSAAEGDLLTKNLGIMCNSLTEQVSLSVTITKPDDDFSNLFELLRSPYGKHFELVRIGISTPGYEFKNAFPREFSMDYGKAFARLVLAIHHLRPDLLIGSECAINGCLMDEATAERMRGFVQYFSRTCSGAKFDILPDFSSHWCFAAHNIPELKIDNIFNYMNLDHMHWQMLKSMARLQRSLGSQCDHATCNNVACSGPCIVHNYYRKNREHLDTQIAANDPMDVHGNC